MAIEYRYRRYKTGDETQINQLYRKVTGRVRSVEQFAWQWLHAPGGQGDIWLIEAVFPDGKTELIGHHGIMPIRFSRGGEDLLFGKTENTMVLPEYRSKILYPRYEKIFAKEYEPRFHALFSTMGPAPAIRQRKAQGYSANHQWLSLEHGVTPYGSFAKLINRFPHAAAGRVLSHMPSFTGRRSVCKLHILSSTEARSESLFNTLWSDFRGNGGVSPRRDAADLNWRFWENPYGQFITVLFELDGEIIGCAVVETSRIPTLSLVDLFFARPDDALVRVVIKDLTTTLLKKFGAKLLNYSCTTDAVSDVIKGNLEASFSPSWISRCHKRFAPEKFMPRKITERGKQIGLTVDHWAVTPILMEGRV